MLRKVLVLFTVMTMMVGLFAPIGVAAAEPWVHSVVSVSEASGPNGNLRRIGNWTSGGYNDSYYFGMRYGTASGGATTNYGQTDMIMTPAPAGGWTGVQKVSFWLKISNVVNQTTQEIYPTIMRLQLNYRSATADLGSVLDYQSIQNSHFEDWVHIVRTLPVRADNYAGLDRIRFNTVGPDNRGEVYISDLKFYGDDAVVPTTYGVNLVKGGTRSSLLSTTTHVFPGVASGYEDQTPNALTVKAVNAGSASAGALAVELTGSNASSFDLSTDSLNLARTDASLIPPTATATQTFTIVPKTGLAAGVHTATVKVTGDNDISKSFDVSFEVAANATYGIDVSEKLVYQFPVAKEGYGKRAAHTVNVTNEGYTGNAGTLAVGLSGVNADAFVLSKDSLEVSTVQADSFTITPANGLPNADTYVATVTISGQHGIEESFNVYFHVRPPRSRWTVDWNNPAAMPSSDNSPASSNTANGGHNDSYKVDLTYTNSRQYGFRNLSIPTHPDDDYFGLDAITFWVKAVPRAEGVPLTAQLRLRLKYGGASAHNILSRDINTTVGYDDWVKIEISNRPGATYPLTDSTGMKFEDLVSIWFDSGNVGGENGIISISDLKFHKGYTDTEVRSVTLNGALPMTLAAGDNVVSAEIYSDVESKTVTFAVALYNNDTKKLVGIKSANIDLEFGKNILTAEAINVPSIGAYTLRAYLWDKSNIRPLSIPLVDLSQ